MIKAPLSRCFWFCCCFVLIFTLIISAEADEVSTISETTESDTDVSSPHGGAAAASCISESDHDSVLRQRDTLQIEVAKSTENLNNIQKELRKAAADLKTQKEFTEKGQKELEKSGEDLKVQKAVAEKLQKELEKAVEDLKTQKQLAQQAEDLRKQLDKKQSEVTSCQDRVVAATDKLESLSSCESKIKPAEQGLSKCSKDLAASRSDADAAHQKFNEKEASFQKEIQNLKALMQKTEATYKSETKQLENKLSGSAKDLAKAKSLVHQMSQDSYLFSFSQFKRTLSKVASLNKAIVEFTGFKVGLLLPATWSDDVRLQYAQVKRALGETYQSQLKPHATLVTAFAAPYIATVKKAYETNCAKSVNQAQQLATERGLAVWEEIKLLAKEYLNVFADGCDTFFVEPLIELNPTLRDIIPGSPIDRVFALMYLLTITSICACLLRCLFFCLGMRLLKLFKAILLLPCSVVGFLCCRRRQSVKASPKKTSTKASSSTKKTPKKDPSPKQQPLEAARKDGVKKEEKLPFKRG